MLSERQHRIYHLRHRQDPPTPWPEIAREVGGDISNVRRGYKAAIRNGVERGLQPSESPNSKPVERAAIEDHDLEARLMERLCDRHLKMPEIEKIAEEEGVTKETALALRRQMMTKYTNTLHELQDVKTATILQLCGDRAKRILESIDDQDIDDASLKEKAIAAGILIDKRQILSGEPTEIIDMRQRDHINVLVQAVIVEAKRRGVEFDTSGEETKVLDVEKLP